jgi:NADPH:quinone reductase
MARGTFGDGPMPPYLAGFEGAGEIVAAGEAVTGLAPGTRAAGAGSGAFAEYMTLPAAAALPVPPGWTEQQALGLVVNWPTALAALRPLGQLSAGQAVLVHAAAGATGQAAVTLAKHSRRADLAAAVRELTGGAGADVVLESAGGATFQASLAAARRVTGRVVVIGSAGGEAAVTNWELVYRHQVHVIGFNIGVLIQAAPQIFGEVMGELLALIAAGVISPGQPAAYDLADGPKALAELEARATMGKLALLP